jgi:hypothetical protein
MRAAVIPILVILLTGWIGPPEPGVLLSIAEVAADRLLDGDPAGAARALGALTRV